MKWTSVVLLSLTGMVLSGTGAYVLTPPGGPIGTVGPDPERPSRETLPEGPFAGAHFAAGSTLRVEGRVGHERVTPGQSTFLLLELKGDEAAPSARAPVDLSLVIDKSGSMRGARLRHAIDAAMGSVQRLSEGDSVSVVAFDERVQTVVPPTFIDVSNRSRVLESLRTIAVGGNTCLSCGLEAGLDQLGVSRLGGTPAGRVAKVVVLSDGEANRGVSDVPGFRALAARARDRSIAITTVGVDVSYNEKVLSAIALESNGRHYFVENDAALPRVFEGEALAATSALASGAEATLELGPGVELERVFDRSFTRAGRRVTVPLGAFTRGEAKTVLVQVRAPAGGATGPTALASVEVSYHDQTTRAPGTCRGSLAALSVRDAGEAAEADPVVVGRVERSETGASLAKASDLFSKGLADEARKLLEGRVKRLLTEKAKAASQPAQSPAAAAGVARAGEDFDRQARALDETQREFARARPAASAAPVMPVAPGGRFAQAPPPAAAPRPRAPSTPPQETREGKAAAKRAIEAADPFSR
ncbi:MAG TPA: VWA domain-containing protein [Polyangiaceae bacterium]|nr:VWA domain-containing protein [Polyangiaceae bacterium]